MHQIFEAANMSVVYIPILFLDWNVHSYFLRLGCDSDFIKDLKDPE